MQKRLMMNLTLCALCAALTCVLAPIAVPIPPIPITLATFAVYLSGALIGPKYGPMSQAIYLILLFIGLPVGAGFVGGVGLFLGPTAGFLIGFVPTSFVIGLLYGKFGKSNNNYINKILWLLLSFVLGTIVCYIFGLLWYMLYSGADFVTAIMVCVVPFLVGDTLKIIALLLLVPQLEIALKSQLF